ncbi:MAG: UvrB/UvrC motif-containing protein [Phycisphaerae bacterium]|nr:UvrB/UvrC motif-containing protein [Phycisphaerae bacterium]
MNATGRPDGQRPNNMESLLEYHETRLDEAEKEGRDAITLDPDECRELRDEAVQYYHRYIALLTLDDFEGVVRDTTRNLRVLDLCAKHAAEESDRSVLEQFRPYLVMMRTRALASQALRDEEPKAAVVAIDAGLDTLRAHYAESGGTQAFDESSEVQVLRGMRDSLVPKLPVSQTGELQARLDKAIADENYELAAILRDELKQLKDHP